MKKIKYSEERDAETGYSYFGARYMDHELMTTWLSVDPMAEKYPNISPYSYCAWNPVILVDPDGRELYEWQFDVQTREMTKVGNGGGSTHQTVSVVYPDGSSFVVEGNGQDINIQSACIGGNYFLRLPLYRDKISYDPKQRVWSVTRTDYK